MATGSTSLAMDRNFADLRGAAETGVPERSRFACFCRNLGSLEDEGEVGTGDGGSFIERGRRRRRRCQRVLFALFVIITRFSSHTKTNDARPFFSTMPFLFPLLLLVSLSTAKLFSPASIPDTWSQSSNSAPPTADLPLTDSLTIAKTVSIIDQKSGAVGNPNQPVPKTFVTAIDGKLVPNLITRSASLLTDYELVFNGSGLSPYARDAAIQGTAYLTFSLLPNSTYNIDGCLRFCDSVPGCSMPYP